MTTLALIVAALPVALAAHAYALYPLALKVLARFRPPTPLTDPAEWPMLSVCLPAYNEEAQLPGALDAVLAADYPRGRLQILVVSDASRDATDDIARRYAEHGVELLRLERRGGKTAAENAAAAHLRAGIIVNTDASIRIHPGALKALARRFSDPAVGVVSGRDVSVAAQDGCANLAETGYVGYEMGLRDLETRLGGIVGASGCLYAIRAELHRAPLPEQLSRDFAAALTAREHGFRAESATDALCMVPRTASLRREFHRKTRTISRGLDTLAYKRHLLNPLRHGGFALKLWSHKVFRWAVPVSAVPAAAALAVLAPDHRWAAALLVLGMMMIVVAAAGWFWPPQRPMPRMVALVAFGVAGNVAVLGALARLARGADDHVWEPTRRAVLPGAGQA